MGTLVFVGAALALHRHSGLAVVVLPLIVIVFLGASVAPGQGEILNEPGSRAQASVSVAQVTEAGVVELLGPGRGDAARRRGARGAGRDGRGGREGARARGQPRRRGRDRAPGSLSPISSRPSPRDKRVVVATATKALQDQLAEQGPAPRRPRARSPRQVGGAEGAVELSLPPAPLRAGPPRRAAAPRRPDARRSAPEADGSGEGGSQAPRTAGVRHELRSCREARRRRGAAPGSLGRLDRRAGTGPSSTSSRRTPAWSSVSVGADECPGARRCPAGERVLRRGGACQGRRRRHRRRQPAPSRGRPALWRGGAPRARRARRRRGARARGRPRRLARRGGGPGAPARPCLLGAGGPRRAPGAAPSEARTPPAARAVDGVMLAAASRLSRTR